MAKAITHGRRRHELRRVLDVCCGEPWFIRPEKAMDIAALLETRARGELLTPDEIRDRIGIRASMWDAPDKPCCEEDDDKPYALTPDGVAILSLEGTLCPRMNLMEEISGGTSTEQFANACREAAEDKDCKAAVIAVDSPGGLARGCEEAAQAVRMLAAAKPCEAIAVGQMCSAAYYIASAAGKVACTPSSEVGSIGTLMIHRENSRANAQAGRTYSVLTMGENKGDGNQYEPLGEKARGNLMEYMGQHYALFANSVAMARKTTLVDVEQRFGQGKVFVGAKAVQAGLADRVATLDQVVGEFSAGIQAQNNPLHAGASPAVLSFDPTAIAAAGNGVVSGQSGAPSAADRSHLSQGSPAMEPNEVSPQPPAAPVAAPVSPTPSASPVAPQPSAASLSSDQIDRIRVEERSRVENLRARGTLLGVSSETIETAINSGLSVERFLVQATDAMSHREPPVGPLSGATPPAPIGASSTLRATGSENERFATQMIDMLSSRALLDTPQRDGAPRREAPSRRPARQQNYMSFCDVARLSLRMVYGRDPMGTNSDIAQAALGDPELRSQVLGMSGNYQTPGDFPNILSGLAARVLEATPPYQGTTFQDWAARRPSLPDRRPTTLLRMGEFGEFPEHLDGDDIEGSKTAEDFSWIQAAEYMDSFGLTPMMIEHDDLGAFTEALSDKQVAHDMTLNRLCINLLVGNVTLGDTYALFDATYHGNLVAAGSGAAPSETTLAAMRKAFRKQKGISNVRKLNYTVKHILAPEDLETTIEKLLANLQVVPTTTDNTQLFRGRITWSIDPMLADASVYGWYGFMDPAIARAIVYAYQVGYESMRTTNWYNPKNHCRIWDFAGRFAAGVNNYRGVAFNAGV